MRFYNQLGGYLSSRLEFISDASKDIAQVFFGVLAIESFTKTPVNWQLIICGIVLSSIWWIVGIISFRIK